MSLDNDVVLEGMKLEIGSELLMFLMAKGLDMCQLQGIVALGETSTNEIMDKMREIVEEARKLSEEESNKSKIILEV